MIALPPVPNPPPPSVKRFDAQGRPTTDQITYERQLQEWLKAIKAALEGLP